MAWRPFLIRDMNTYYALSAVPDLALLFRFKVIVHPIRNITLHVRAVDSIIWADPLKKRKKEAVLKTMVVGAQGALGSDLMKVLANAVAATRQDFDLTDHEATRTFILDHKPDVLINTAAFHNVPLCETEAPSAFAVNSTATKILAQVCAEAGTHLIHISTDYVFDGSKRAPYTEEDLPKPQSIYAISKVAGEHAALAYGDRVAVVRTCGLYGEVPTRVKGRNFITAMLQLGKEREQVTVVDDEIVAPTYTLDLAHALNQLAKKEGRGLFHITNSGETSWFDFAKVIFEVADLPAKLLPISAAEFAGGVKRPSYSILDNHKYEQLSGAPMPSWENALRRHLKALSL